MILDSYQLLFMKYNPCVECTSFQVGVFSVERFCKMGMADFEPINRTYSISSRQIY